MSSAHGLKSQSYAWNAGVAEGGVVNEASSRNYGQPAERQRLLHVGRIIKTKAVVTTGEFSGDGIVDRAILILKLVSDSGVGPTALDIVTLIVEAGAIDVDQSQKGRVDGSKRRVLGRNAAVSAAVLKVVFEAGEAVSPV